MDIRFTPRELDIMGVLWDRGPSTVSEVMSRRRFFLTTPAMKPRTVCG